MCERWWAPNLSGAHQCTYRPPAKAPLSWARHSRTPAGAPARWAVKQSRRIGQPLHTMALFLRSAFEIRSPRSSSDVHRAADQATGVARGLVVFPRPPSILARSVSRPLLTPAHGGSFARARMRSGSITPAPSSCGAIRAPCATPEAFTWCGYLLLFPRSLVRAAVATGHRVSAPFPRRRRPAAQRR